jgi:hypothetical protein
MYTGTRHGKDPHDTKWEKGIDWERFLALRDPSFVVTDSQWFITCADEESPTLVVADDSIVVGGKRTQALFSGGTEGLEYGVTNRITYGDGRTKDDGFTVVISER